MNKFDIFLKSAFDKLFQSAGFEGFDENFAKQDNWFQERTWSSSKSNEFKKWFINRAVKDLKFTKKKAEVEHAWFNLKWGWKEDDSKKVN